MEKTTKITKRMAIERALEMNEVQADEIVKNYLVHELELLDKKSTSRKTTANQENNKEIKEIIVAKLVELGRSVTITELQKESEELGEYSNQKLSALLKQLKEDGRVDKMKDKKATLFFATGTEEE